MKLAAYRWYKDVTKENVCIQSLEFCTSLKLDLKNELEVNIDLNLKHQYFNKYFKTSLYIAFCNTSGSTFDLCILSSFSK